MNNIQKLLHLDPVGIEYVNSYDVPLSMHFHFFSWFIPKCLHESLNLFPLQVYSK